MPRTQTARFKCSHPECREFAHYSFQYKDEGQRIYADNGNGKYKCTRHNHPDTVLGLDRLKIVTESASKETVPGHLFWGRSGFEFGPGFRAWANDFPEGTILRVTAEILLPAKADGAAPETPKVRHPQLFPHPTSSRTRVMTTQEETEARTIPDEQWMAMTDQQWLEHRISRCADEGWAENKERYARILAALDAARGMREALEACHALIQRDYSDARAAALEGHPIARDAQSEWHKVCDALALSPNRPLAEEEK